MPPQLLQLREPWWLLLILLPLGYLLLATIVKYRRNNGYAESHLFDWVISHHYVQQRRWTPLLFIQLTWLCLAVALAGPRIATSIYTTDRQDFTEVMLIVDVSYSMTARDIKPSRMTRVKLELLDLVERMQRTRIGIIAYAGKPHLITPPTHDQNALRHYINSLHTRLLPTRGSQIYAALEYALSLPRQANQPRFLLLISDGEHSLTAPELKTAQTELSLQLREKNAYLFTLGAATRHGATLLNLQETKLNIAQQSQAVVSLLDEQHLQSLANLGSGKYHVISDNDDEWQALYDQGILSTAISSQNSDSALIIWQEYFFIPLLLALFFLLLSVANLSRTPVPTVANPHKGNSL